MLLYLYVRIYICLTFHRVSFRLTVNGNQLCTEVKIEDVLLFLNCRVGDVESCCATCQFYFKTRVCNCSRSLSLEIFPFT